MSHNKWGFLRETDTLAKVAGFDLSTGLHRTGLEVYLAVIFPTTKDWIHDKAIGEVNGIKYRMRPDYRSEELKLIVEFDGVQHYTKPSIIKKDIRNEELYKTFGYNVVRIPYFIQLSNKSVKTLFAIEVSEELFDESIPSLSAQGQHSPAYLCPAGLKRMAQEFKRFPEQYKTNRDFLISQDDPFETGVEFLEEAYNSITT